MGAGRTEVVSAVFGLTPATSGEILLQGVPTRITCPAEAIAAGIGMVTEDRKGLGIVPAMSVGHNLTLAALPSSAEAPSLTPLPKGAPRRPRRRISPSKPAAPSKPFVNSVAATNKRFCSPAPSLTDQRF